MHIIVVGGGQTGSYLASLLAGDGHVVRVVEHRRNLIAKLENELPKECVVFGNGSDAATLEEAGILRADVVVSVTGDDEVNLVVSMLAKMEYGVSRVIARVNNPRNSWMFNQGMGVDVGINQADILARFVQEGLDLKDVYTLMKLGLGEEEHSIVQIEVRPDAKVAGKPLKDIELPGQTVLIAIMRAGEILIPNGSTVLSEGDSIIAFTDGAGREGIRHAFA
ncbi:MAG: NAD-binding protein [Olegusella sp.]|nr:NAD-binding protein [Olegusella sp.]MCI1933901.1 NAD-binding protein [Atopobiaceae bacterium]NLH92006.1 TrkA family potassium uptake protein [Atopobium sp.]